MWSACPNRCQWPMFKLRKATGRRPLTRTRRSTLLMDDLKKTALAELSKWSNLVPPSVLQTPPIDLETIGSYWNVKGIVKRELDVAGILYRLDKNRSVVILKKDDSPGRQRFSWAHELGHIVMASDSMPRVSCRKSSSTNKALERSCDVIATEILMPRQLFSSAANQYGWTLGVVAQLAQHFQVSVQASALRLLELHGEPVVISVWRSLSQQPLLKLKLMWSRHNELAKPLKPDLRWKKDPEALLPLYQAFKVSGITSGPTRVLVRQECGSGYRSVLTEALGVGRGEKRRVLGFHYLLRQA